VDQRQRRQAPAAADPPDGARLYAVRCADCHGADATGVRGPDLTRVWARGAADDRVLQTIRQRRARPHHAAEHRAGRGDISDPGEDVLRGIASDGALFTYGSVTVVVTRQNALRIRPSCGRQGRRRRVTPLPAILLGGSFSSGGLRSGSGT
jgi:hypothetical protein